MYDICSEGQFNQSHSAFTVLLYYLCVTVMPELNVVRWFFDVIVSHTWFMNFNFGHFECLQFNAFFRFNYNESVLCAFSWSSFFFFINFRTSILSIVDWRSIHFMLFTFECQKKKNWVHFSTSTEISDELLIFTHFNIKLYH